MLGRGNFPRFARNTVKNIESSWETLRENVGMEDAGGAVGFAHAVRDVLFVVFAGGRACTIIMPPGPAKCSSLSWLPIGSGTLPVMTSSQASAFRLCLSAEPGCRLSCCCCTMSHESHAAA